MLENSEEIWRIREETFKTGDSEEIFSIFENIFRNNCEIRNFK